MEKNELFAYSWHLDDEEQNRTVIRIYGLDEKNENVCVIVKDFTPYVYIQLPENIDWDDTKATLVSNKIDSLLEKENREPVLKQLQYKKRLYYASLDKNGKKKTYPYLFLSFNHPEDIKQLGFKLRRPLIVSGIGTMNLKMHEHNASPILQLTSLRKIPTAGWIKFTGKRVKEEDQITYCKYEYEVKWKNLAEKKSDTIARPLLMGYDIEVNSSIPNSMPKAWKPEDEIFQISCVFGRQGSKMETYENYLLTLGKPDDIDNVTKLCYDTEYELLLGFTDLLKKKQPNICIGYNIFTFDIPYMIDRATLNGCINEFKIQGFPKLGHARERSINWSSTAYKNQSFQFLDAEGRIFVDLLPLVRRDYRMSNYKLKTISTHFLKDMTKDPLDAKGIFKCYRLGMIGDARGKKALSYCGKYCVKDSLLVVRLFEVLTTWIALCEMSKVTGTPIFSLYTQGQQIKIFSQVYRKATHENTVVEKDAYIVKDDDYYVGATIFPPVPGVYDQVVPLDFTSLYPSAIIAYNICWSTLVTDDNIPDDNLEIMTWEDHIGCQHDSTIIRKTEINTIIKSREAELKELRRQRDLRENKYIKDEFKAKIDEIIKDTKPLREERVILNKNKPKHIICSKRKYRWLKKPAGVLPEILKNLLDTRKITKNLMKDVKVKLKGMKETDKDYIDVKTYYDVLDQRQLSLKLSSNSGYGITGARKGYLTCMPVAMCTTYMGRCAILKASEVIQKDYKGVLIYGDTDSNYVSFPHLTTPKELWDYTTYVAKEVSKLYPSPMSLAYEEKIFTRFLILTKKRYMSLECDRDGKTATEISKKGVLLQRRDNCNFVRKVYGDVVMMIFEKKGRDEILYYIIQELNKLCSGFYPHTEFVVTKSVGDMGWFVGNRKEHIYPHRAINEKGKECYKIGDYTVKLLPEDEKKRHAEFKKKNCDTDEEYYLHSLPAQAQLAEKMRQRGQLVASGSRIEYVITTTGGHTAKLYMKLEDADYFSKHSSVLSIDYHYYLKQITNPLDQILDVIYNQDIREAKDMGEILREEYKFLKGFLLGQYKYRIQIREKVLNELRDLIKTKLVFKG